MITLIEATVITYLIQVLDTDRVYAETPAEPPEEYWLVELTSSGESNHIQSATIAVQAISNVSMLRAAEMSQAAVKAMREITLLQDVSKCQLNSKYNYTDTTMRQYRYQAVFDLVYMEGE